MTAPANGTPPYGVPAVRPATHDAAWRSAVELEHVSRVYGEEVTVFALRDVSLSDHGRRVHLHRRAVGIGQVDDARPLGGPRPSHLRHDPGGRVGRRRARRPHALTASGRLDRLRVPAVPPHPAPDRARQRRDRPALPRHAPEGAPGACPGRPRDPRPRPPGRPPPDPDVRRRAAAGGARPRHRHRAAHDPGRRADRGPRLRQRRARARHLRQPRVPRAGGGDGHPRPEGRRHGPPQDLDERRPDRGRRAPGGPRRERLSRPGRGGLVGPHRPQGTHRC